MGLFDALRGIRRPSPDITPRSEASLRGALLALGTDTEPFVVRVSRPGEPGQLVAELKIVDARWFELFARAGLRKTFAIFLVLDAARHTVRGLDRSTTLQWRAGVPSPAAGGEVKWGRQMTAEAAIGFGFRDDLSYGPVYRYAFRSKDLEQPLWTTVLDHGPGRPSARAISDAVQWPGSRFAGAARPSRMSPMLWRNQASRTSRLMERPEDITVLR